MFNLTAQERKIAFFLVITLVVGSGVLFFKSGKLHRVKPELVKEEPRKDAKKEVITIHLSGAVFQPGLYRFEKGSRLADVIQKTDLMIQADISRINLAGRISDGEKIFIPFKSGTAPSGVEASSILINKVNDGGYVNINQASVSELLKLPGIGEILARNITEFRNRFGIFKDKEELKKVKGIGEKRLEKIRNLIVID